MAFLLMISVFFFYVNPSLGVGFFVANIIIILYIAFFWDSLSKEKNIHEIKMNENEKFIIDILNNIDKVISRGQNHNEMNKFSKMTNDCIQSGIRFLSYATNHVMVLNTLVCIIIFGCSWYLISLQFKKKMTSTMFITMFTILLIYRERMLSVIQNIPDYLEFIGRLEYIIEHFNTMLGGKKNIFEIVEKKYGANDLKFDTITFKNVDFVYASNKNSRKIFEQFSMTLDIQNKVIGITGLSGKGKSSFAKLILRLYEPSSGEIYIDGVNIKDIDPNYIRKNVVYISQNSKLFDKKIIENIHYGCENSNHCEAHIDVIMKYDKIKNLFKNIDIHNDVAGSLGENLSGGQRQVVNIISGLINPAKILILDEPTNALDADLKKEIIALINQYRKYKKCIIVITHDRDTYSIFDKMINI
jgi:ABC-type bacteriocin/lantibiotic exporter with double-glycine peptidase domain